jgi:serine protease
MKIRLFRSVGGALVAGALAAVGVYAVPTGSAGWQPVTYGLTQNPEELLPAVVSVAQPARIVSTTVGSGGELVVRVRKATDKTAAVKLIKDGQQADGAAGVEIDSPVHALGAPTGPDPFRSRQWSLAAMRVAEAWPVSTGEGVTVAVIDTGVDSQHPDLAANVLSGYDATTGVPGESTDVHGHGTHVAGTIASLTGNGVGVTAVAPDVRILPVKVLSDDGSGYMSDTAKGIIWAVGNGAQVINMSLGGPTRSVAVSNAVAYARSMGVTVVAAVGNEREQGSPVSYPGADEGVIGVAATTSPDAVAHYSNAGDYVDVAAPGSAIISTYPVARGSYASSSGTSMASPHVAATAALLKAYQPALTPDRIEDALERSAVDLGAPGFDSDYGHGRIDAVAALAAVTPVIEPPVSEPTTETPTVTPTTQVPTAAPTTQVPTAAPTTAMPTTVPTPPVTTSPTTAPTTNAPTVAPTVQPTIQPTATPTPTRTAAPRLTPVITSNVRNREVTYGTRTSVRFTVRMSGVAAARKPVRICVTPAGARMTCATATTDARGTVVVSRTAKAGFRMHAEVIGTSTTNSAKSTVATFTVRAKVAVKRHSKGAMTVKLTGATGQTVRVQRYVKRTWRTVSSVKAKSQTTVRGLIRGQRYRVVVPNTTAIRGVTSSAITV